MEGGRRHGGCGCLPVETSDSPTAPGHYTALARGLKSSPAIPCAASAGGALLIDMGYPSLCSANFGMHTRPLAAEASFGFPPATVLKLTQRGATSVPNVTDKLVSCYSSGVDRIWCQPAGTGNGRLMLVTMETKVASRPRHLSLSCARFCHRSGNPAALTSFVAALPTCGLRRTCGLCRGGVDRGPARSNGGLPPIGKWRSPPRAGAQRFWRRLSECPVLQ